VREFKYNRRVAKVERTGGGMRAGSMRARRAGAAPGSPEQAGGMPADVLPLIAQIDESGRELLKDPTGHALERYKRALRLLLDAAVADGMRVSSESTLGFSRRVFSTIARVDVALSDMADAVLGRQQDLLKLAALVDQVKGLIIDLYR
jgi:uncharacterized protein YaaR (DUF327 family)